MDGRNAVGENSGDATAPYAGINGWSSKEADSQAQNTLVTGFFNYSNRGSINNNNPTPSTDHKSMAQHGRHESAGKPQSVFEGRNETSLQLFLMKLKQKQQTKETNQQGEDLNEQQGTNTKNMSTHSTASTTETSNFSFAMTGTSSHLTPILNAGNLQNDDKDGR